MAPAISRLEGVAVQISAWDMFPLFVVGCHRQTPASALSCAQWWSRSPPVDPRPEF
jgi:hypothetical protein